MGFSKSSSKREDYSNKILPQEIRKISHNLNLHLKHWRKKKKKNSKLVKGIIIIKIRAEINEIEMKKAIENVNKAKR